MSAAAVPAYFEESWAILSSIGLINVFFGVVVFGTASSCPAILVPIITSAAGAIANGLCYYAFYAHHQTTGTMVAAAVTDISWLIQEAGMSFYSYLILIRILKARERRVFRLMFWTLILSPVVFRTVILQARARDILSDSLSQQSLVDHLHIGYFISIAMLECVSAFFLLRKFTAAKNICCQKAMETTSLFQYLMRSTEIRVSTLAVIGFSRAITYSFQTQQQAATSTASQFDRFVYTLECMFPVMMFIDILAPKYIFSSTMNGNDAFSPCSHRSSPLHSSRYTNRGEDFRRFSISRLRTKSNASGLGCLESSSQDRIIEAPELARTASRGEERKPERDPDLDIGWE
ncbi:hypothetical protein B7463_g2063, partial [Scytalidium lignicola]